MLNIMNEYSIQHTALIDTGADVNCIREDLIPLRFYEKTSHLVSAANGQSLKARYKLTDVYICNGGQKVKISFVLFKDLKQGIILGTPFINNLKPFIVDAHGIHTQARDPNISFWFNKEPEDMLVNDLFSALQFKEKFINVLSNTEDKDCSDSFNTKILNNKGHIRLSYIKEFSRIPFDNRYFDIPVRMNDDLLAACKEEIKILIKDNLIKVDYDTCCLDSDAFPEHGVASQIIDYKSSDNLVWVNYQVPEYQIENITHGRIFSKFYIKMGFWQMQVIEENRLKTVLILPFSFYTWRRRPPGFTHFQQQYLKFLEQYLDDCREFVILLPTVIIVFSRNFEEHWKQIEIFFRYFNEILISNIHFRTFCRKKMTHQALILQAKGKSSCLAPASKKTRYFYNPGLKYPEYTLVNNLWNSICDHEKRQIRVYMTHLVHLLKEKDEKFLNQNQQLKERFINLSHEINYLYPYSNTIALTSHEMFQILGIPEYIQQNICMERLNREQLWSKLNILPQDIQDVIKAKVEDDNILSLLKNYKEHTIPITGGSPRFAINLNHLPLYIPHIDAGLVYELQIAREPPFFYNPMRLKGLPAIIKTAIFLSPITLAHLQFNITSTLHERRGPDYFPSLQIWEITTFYGIPPWSSWFNEERYDISLDRFQSTIWFYKKLETLFDDYSYFMTDGLRIICTDICMGETSHHRATKAVIDKWMTNPPLGPETKEAYDVFMGAKQYHEESFIQEEQYQEEAASSNNASIDSDLVEEVIHRWDDL